MTTTTNVNQVKLNIMTQSQYDLATKNPNELYMVTDAELLPSQTGNSGKFLTTNGSSTSWGSALTSSDIVASVSSSSTNSKAVGAKLFYDTCGDIETLINAL